ncbi:hypothetical protein LAUMK191_00685 [Mycobacterium attenuatum]|nr:hypothetical protein LAUMK191_00685 [Mycobacterium attenuatum]
MIGRTGPSAVRAASVGAVKQTNGWPVRKGREGS